MPREVMTTAELTDRVMQLAGIPDRKRATKLAEATVANLCGRLSGGEVEDLKAEMAGIFEAICGYHGEPPEFMGDYEQFVDRVASAADVHPGIARRATVVVFHALWQLLPEDKARHVAAQLPRDLKAVWLGSAIQEGRMLTRDELVGLLQANLGLASREQTDVAIAAVTHLLHRRLAAGEVGHLVAHVPAGLQEFLHLRPEESRIREPFGLDYDEFVAEVADIARLSPDKAKKATRLVFHTIKEYLPASEVGQIADELPARLKTEWLEA